MFGTEEKMSFSNVPTDGSLLKNHMQLLELMLAVLLVSFVSFKVRSNARAAARAKRRTEWIVSKDPATGEPICDRKQFLR
jgi:hypothetical protein